MDTVLFTHLKNVKEYAERYYLKHQNQLDFDTIIRCLYTQGALTDSPLYFRRAKKVLTDTEFYQHVLDQVVAASLIISNTSRHDISEQYGFLGQKDIYTMVTLPFIHARPHVHDYYELLYVYSGTCTYYFQDTSFRLHKGQFLILSPDTRHSIIMDEQGLGLTINVKKSTFQNTFHTLLREHNLLSDFFAHTLYDAQESNYITFNIENTLEYNYLIQQIFDESNSIENYSNMLCVSLLNLFFGKLLQDFGRNIHMYKNVKNHSFNNSFPLMLKYVQSNYRTLPLPQMSQIFHYNESYISSLFKKYLHENFSIVVQNLRLEDAKKILETTDYNIEKTAETVGYDSADYFSRIFKKKYGISPSLYRKKFHSS